MSYSVLGLLAADRFSSSHVRTRVTTSFDDLVLSFGVRLVSYWKLQNDGIDQKGVASTTLQGGPELSVPTIVLVDTAAEGAPADGTVIAWSGDGQRIDR